MKSQGDDVISCGGAKEMAELQLKVAKKTDNGVFGKAINNFNKVLYSSGGGFYSFYLSSKRNSLLKAFANYEDIKKMANEAKQKVISEKYEKAYETYLNTLERYITDTIYTKAQKRVSTNVENAILSEYYEVNSLKGVEYNEYRYRIQLMLLKMDWNTILSTKSDGYVNKFKKFYVAVVSGLYKSIMRHYAIQVTNTSDKEKVFQKIYNLTEEYIVSFLPYAVPTEETKLVSEAYKAYVDGIDGALRKDYNDLKRELNLLELTRRIFAYSLPTVAAEECYLQILEKARLFITNTYISADKFEMYNLLLQSMQSYYENILSMKTVWDDDAEKKAFEELWTKFSEYKKLANIDYDEYLRLREVLFITEEIKRLKKSERDYSALFAYYRDRMKQQRGLRYFKNSVCKIEGRWRTRRRLTAD